MVTIAEVGAGGICISLTRTDSRYLNNRVGHAYHSSGSMFDVPLFIKNGLNVRTYEASHSIFETTVKKVFSHNCGFIV